jgi:Recombination, repair and ssDNA binding protein UvsY
MEEKLDGKIEGRDKLTELFERVEADLEVSEGNVAEKSLRCGYIYGKWLREFTSRSMELKQKRVDLEVSLGKLTKFYKEEYNRDLKATEIEKYLFNDEKYVKLYRQVRVLESVCEYLEGAVKKFANLGFDIKNYIEIKKFLNGVG